MRCLIYIYIWYRESHYKFRTAVRVIMDSLAEEAREFEVSGERPSDEFQQKMGSHGLLAANIGPGKFLKEFNIQLPGGITAEEYDYFHEMIVHQEVRRKYMHNRYWIYAWNSKRRNLL